MMTRTATCLAAFALLRLVPTTFAQTSFATLVPTALTAFAPASSPIIPFIPTAATTDDDISPECQDEASSVEDCFNANTQCIFACQEREGGTAPVCENLDQNCNFLNCCPACINVGQTFLACEASVRGCGYDCSAVAPSPVAPSAPATPTPCEAETEQLTLCALSNLFQCGLSCNFTEENTPGAVTCDTTDEFCQAYACCPECENDFKVLANCVLDLQSCPTNCGEVAPSVPAPAAPVTPVCQDFELAASSCYSIFESVCSGPCDKLFGDNATTDDAILGSCDGLNFICDEIPCCPECLSEFTALVSCQADIAQCETKCNVVSPVSPPVISPPAMAPFPSAPSPMTKPQMMMGKGGKGSMVTKKDGKKSNKSKFKLQKSGKKGKGGH